MSKSKSNLENRDVGDIDQDQKILEGQFDEPEMDDLFGDSDSDSDI